jgi:hypothetical protein|tara:strand:+ start:205 stop:396 length:192 start_codon:yes stop_codon:yes gene_type:complete
MIHTIYIIGILFIILGFVLLLLATTEVRKVNKEIIRQQQLSESFIKAKQNEKNTFNYKHTILN